MTNHLNFNAPWTLHFDRDGTEDVAVICDSNMTDLATSRHFWLPQDCDPVPATLAGFWLMVAAPKLFDALVYLLEQTVEMELKHGIRLCEGELYARNRALAAIAAVNRD